MLDPNFYPKLNQIAQELGMNPRDLLLIMYSESGLNTQAKNPEGAYGLIQWTNGTLKGMGLSKEDILNSPGSKQLDYVKQYVKNQMGFIGHPFHSASEYYHANFFPLTLKRWHGTDPEANKDVVVVSGSAKSPQERQAYEHNTGLDYNKDGVITVGDLTNVLLSRANSKGFQAALTQLNSVAGNGNVTEIANGQKLDTPAKNNIPSDKSMLTSNKPEENSWLSSFFDKLTHFLSSFASQDSILIVLGNEDPIVKLEFAEILTSALQEELQINSVVKLAQNQVEIECQGEHFSEEQVAAVKELTSALVQTFSYATRKMGNLKIGTVILPRFKSKFSTTLELSASEINHRKFLLKYASKNKEIK